MGRFLKYALLFLAVMSGSALTGKEYPSGWKEGYLDIHFISTGAGNCAFMVMPDGTTMLIDAGEEDPTSPRTQSPRNTRRYPDYSRHAYQWQAAYIRRVLDSLKSQSMDYALVTHYHGDHYGTFYPGIPQSEKGSYFLSGITGVGEIIRIDKLIDRGYDYPYDMGKAVSNGTCTDRTFANYLAFIRFSQKNCGMKYESFQTGSDTQLRMLHQPERFGNFSIRNIVSNGTVIRNGKTFTLMPSADEIAEGAECPGENHLSCGILVRYGNFSMFIGGDIPGSQPDYEQRPQWWDVESLAADSVGEVDVTTTNHHANRDAMSAYFLSVLKPRVIIQEVWSSDHPGHEALLRMTSQKIWKGERDIFSTNMLESNRIVIGELMERSYRSFSGHILLRVSDNGNSYTVYTLNHETDDPYITGRFEYKTKKK